MALAALAIRGHRSAHSLATGPVMADPVENSRHRYGMLFCTAGKTFHFAFGIDNDTRIVFKVDKHTVLSPPRLALTDHHGWRHWT